MKRLFIICFVFICITGCRENDGVKYDKKILKDDRGNYYQLRHWRGDAFFVEPYECTKKF